MYQNAVQNLSAHLDAMKKVEGQDKEIHHAEINGSLLTWCFNSLWAMALNLKEESGLDYFLLWHADVKPVTEGWLETLIKELRDAEGDVISAIVPIKDARGLTSTARDSDPFRPIRITQHEAVNILPVSWTSEDVLLNTGLMLVDFSKPWVYDVCFTMQDRIVRRGDGKFIADIEPEDWNFSRQLHRKGLKLVATRAVTVEHFGVGTWRSDQVWGWETDRQNVPLKNEVYEVAV